MKCFYHNDLDGRCAGAIVAQYTDKKAVININYKEIVLEKNNKKYTMICDEEDYNYLTSLNIYIGGDGYAVTRINGKIKRIHRIIMNIDDPKILVDHINRNILDNRKSNLRFCNKQYNEFNEKPIRKNNTSGFKGVTWDKDNNKWKSSIMINGKNINLGRYLDKNDAVKARLEAELYYCGKEYSSQRELFKEYNIDCSKIAEKYGGGGHKGAAGFNSDKLLFKKIKPKDCSMGL